MKVRTSSVLFLAAYFAAGFQTRAQEFFVSAATGNDSNAGTNRAEPLKTLKTATERLANGSVITLLSGWYEGGVTLKPGTKDRPTILGAEKPGRVFIGRPEIVSGFERVAGLEYAYAAPCDRSLPTLTEMDTGFLMRSMASADDVEELAGSYFHDEQAKKVYVHPSDSAGVAHHLYATVRKDEVGVTMADHTVVDGLTLAGFGNAAIFSPNCTSAVVQNCTFYLNGYGALFSGGRDCVIRNNEAWANRPSYDQGAQIHISCTPPADGFLVEKNHIHDAPSVGIFFYSGTARDCLVRGNLLHGNVTGFFFKVNDDLGKLVAERNVGFGHRYGDLSAPIMRQNTYAAFHALHRGVKGSGDLDVAALGSNARFADPAYRDYRLQSDSPARGKMPGGSDLGAFPYDGSVVFVKPDGDDAKAGTSFADAWRSLAHATKKLKPGQTLYVAEANWKEPLVLSGLKSDTSKPTVIRARGWGRVELKTIRIESCENLKLENLRVRAGGIQVRDSKTVELVRCASLGSREAGVTVANSSGVTFDHGALAYNQCGVRVESGCSDVAVISSLLIDNKSAHFQLASAIPGFYSNFNAFSDRLDEWRKQSGQDADSVVATPNGFRTSYNKSVTRVTSLHDDFAVRAGHALAFSGRFAQPAGPDGAVVIERIERKPIERVEVVSTTRTSANITFGTPGRRVGTIIEWGKTPSYGNVHDRTHELVGEYETLHTVSLLGLEPDTVYHFRVGWRNWWATNKEKIDGQDPVIWSDDFSLKTATTDLPPRRLYVSLEGNDSKDGLSPAAAWRSLRKAAGEARAGDTVTIAPGRYMELLRPLQTGTSAERGITFRAEKPLTVFLDGGFIKFQRDGRSHCIQIQNKAYLRFENLACERVTMHDNGGYRDGFGYSGLIGISGSAGIEIKGCVMDGRHRWMPCLWVFEAGKMPGVPDNLPGFTVTDSVLLNGWRALGYSSVRPCVIRNSALVRAMTGCITELGANNKLVLHNNIITSNILSKKSVPLWNQPQIFDSDYNCFVWDPENDNRFILDKTKGLAGWQTKSGQDAHSLEADPAMPLIARMGYAAGDATKDRDTPDSNPLKIEDMLLAPSSPCRGKGENGEDIGPRWSRFLAPCYDLSKP